MERQKQIVYEEKQILRKDHMIFWGAVFCFWFATYIYVPVFGLYLDNIGFSYSAIGIVLGSYGVTQILLRFPFGILSDVLSPLRKQLLISGFAMSLLSQPHISVVRFVHHGDHSQGARRYDRGDVGDGNRFILAVFYKRSIIKSDGHPAVFNGPSPIHQHGSQRLPRPFVRLDVSVLDRCCRIMHRTDSVILH